MQPTGPSAAGRSPAPPFSEHFERATQSLRGALTDLFASAGVDPAVPQAVARGLGIDKNLAWKVCKIVNGPDVYRSVKHLPGSAGMNILLDAFARAGAGARSLDAVRNSLTGFDEMLALHAGDRATLELMLDSMLAEREASPRLEQARKLAFQGNSAILGIRARLRVAVSILAPSRVDPDFLEVTIVTGLVDLKRLRPTVVWPLVRFHTQVEEEEGGTPRIEPLDPGSVHPGGAPLLSAFSSSPLPAIRSRPGEAGDIYELCEGPVGMTAKATLLFGWTFPRFATWRAQSENDRGEYFIRIDTPSELCLHDLLVHRDLPIAQAPEADFYSLILGPVASPLVQNASSLLPRTENVQELGSGPPVLATPHHARHLEIVRWSCEKRGWSLEEFRGYRLMASFPPVPSLGILHFPLAR